jgi:hypothetical protein
MRQRKSIAVTIFLLGLAASSVVWANGFAHHPFPQHAFPLHGQFHDQARFGIIIGAPLVAPWRYRSQIPYYVYAYPPTMTFPAASSPYVEQGSEQGSIDQGSIDQENDQAVAQQPTAFWYYCNNPQGYYPDVRVCPNGWKTVPAQPPDS